MINKTINLALTSRLKSRRRQDPGSKFVRTIIGILATIGIIDTGAITLERWGLIKSMSCPGNNQGCDIVLDSAWGTIFESNNTSIPLSLIGFICYLLILLLSLITFLPSTSLKRLDINRAVWWSLFLLSICMTTFSIVLMSIMIFKIKVYCFFCILSALISSLILILTIAGGGWEERRDLILRGLIVSIIVLLGSLIWSSSVDPNKKNIMMNKSNSAPEIINPSSISSIKLAEHLRLNNFILYNAYWCPHCHDQKELFGKEAASKLIIIECAPDGENSRAKLCKQKGINGFPSWEINGKIISGVKSLDKLSELSGYNGSKDF